MYHLAIGPTCSLVDYPGSSCMNELRELTFRDIFSSLHFLLWNCYIVSSLLRTSQFIRFFQRRLLISRLSTCFFQSLSRDHPLQAFHHLPKVFHFSHQPRHLRTSLALEHSAPLLLGPGDGAPRCVELYPTATVATYQMPVGHRFLGHSFPSRRHRFGQPSCSCVVLKKPSFFHLIFTLGKCPKVSFFL